MSYQVINPFIQFIDPINGNPLSAGQLYFGRIDSDPKNQSANRINVYAVQDNGSEVLLAQPITLNGAGQPQYSGSVKQIKVELYAGESAYAIQVFSRGGAQKGYSPRVYAPLNATDGVRVSELAATNSTILIAGVEAQDIAKYHNIFVYNFTSPEAFGAVKIAATGDIIDATSAVQQAINTGIPVLLSGFYSIDPSVGVKLKNGSKIQGIGLYNSGFLAKYNTAGSVITREFNPAGPNEYVTDTVLSDFSVFLNHIIQAPEPTNVQIGVNLSNISRTKTYRVYSGNYRWGVCEARYANGSKPQSMRGYGFVYGNVSAGNPAYCGGEVHTNEDCKSWWAKKCVGIDLFELTGGASAAYATNVNRLDAQTCEKGIAQESQYNTGCTYSDYIIQDMKQASGSTGDVIGIEINGYENSVRGGYFESSETDLDYFLKLGSSSRNNRVTMPYLSTSNAKRSYDVGANNLIDGFASDYTSLEYTQNKQLSTKAFVTFDDAGTIIGGYGVLSVSKNGTGDFNVNWLSGYAVNESTIKAYCYTNASGMALSCGVRTHSSTTSRVVSFNDSGAAADSAKYVVEVVYYN